jgi:hypothetical protein
MGCLDMAMRGIAVSSRYGEFWVCAVCELRRVVRGAFVNFGGGVITALVEPWEKKIE